MQTRINNFLIYILMCSLVRLIISFAEVAVGRVRRCRQGQHAFSVTTKHFDDGHMSTLSKVANADRFCTHLTERVLEHQNVRNLLNSKETFDLEMYENFPNDAFVGFAYHYNAPFVILSTMGASKWTNSRMGNPNNPAYISDPYLSYAGIMSFWERTCNTLIYMGSEIFTSYRSRKQNQTLHKFFPDAPHISDLMYNASLMLLNSHPSFTPSFGLLPNMIEIGGCHVKEPKTLPKELKDYLDSAKDGVIYFSLGSYLKGTSINEEKRNAIISSFGKLKQKVLWKWEDDVLPGKPSNVEVHKWLPQQDILAHPNVKLFITHGGLLSIIEATHFGVPILGIAITFDQGLNIARAEEDGYGLGVPYSDLSETSLTSALKELLNNVKYSENVRKRSKLLRDREVKPLDRATYWMEYVIRHRGAPHLKTSALDLSWYQILLLDVIGALILAIAVAVWLVSKVIKIVRHKLRRNQTVTNKDKLN